MNVPLRVLATIVLLAVPTSALLLSVRSAQADVAFRRGSDAALKGNSTALLEVALAKDPAHAPARLRYAETILTREAAKAQSGRLAELSEADLERAAQELSTAERTHVVAARVYRAEGQLADFRAQVLIARRQPEAAKPLQLAARDAYRSAFALTPWFRDEHARTALAAANAEWSTERSAAKALPFARDVRRYGGPALIDGRAGVSALLQEIDRGVGFPYGAFAEFRRAWRARNGTPEELRAAADRLLGSPSVAEVALRYGK